MKNVDFGNLMHSQVMVGDSIGTVIAVTYADRGGISVYIMDQTPNSVSNGWVTQHPLTDVNITRLGKGRD